MLLRNPRATLLVLVLRAYATSDFDGIGAAVLGAWFEGAFLLFLFTTVRNVGDQFNVSIALKRAIAEDQADWKARLR